MNVKNDIEKYLNAAIEFYGNKNTIKLILQTGSSLSKDLTSCFDIDFIIFVDDEQSDGFIYLTVDDIHVDVKIIPFNKRFEIMQRCVDEKNEAMLDMIMIGESVYGDIHLIDDIKSWINNTKSNYNPIFFRDQAGWAANNLLYSLKHATTKTDMMSISFSIFLLMSKVSGPSLGTFPKDPKYFARQLEINDIDSKNSFQTAIENCIQGNKEPLINYFETWIKIHDLPKITHVKFFRPPEVKSNKNIIPNAQYNPKINFNNTKFQYKIKI